MATRKGYYVVFKGRTPGVYNDINDFKAQVYNFKGSEFKKFSTFKEAQEAWNKGKRGVASSEKNTAVSADVDKPKSKKISLAPHWENYMACICLHMIWPALPILIEWFLTGDISVEATTLTASIYAITIGMSSKSKSQFTISVLISFIFACCYGFTVHVAHEYTQQNNIQELAKNTFINLRLWALVSIGLIFITHLIERYNRHVIDRTPFFNF